MYGGLACAACSFETRLVTRRPRALETRFRFETQRAVLHNARGANMERVRAAARINLELNRRSEEPTTEYCNHCCLAMVVFTLRFPYNGLLSHTALRS